MSLTVWSKDHKVTKQYLKKWTDVLKDKIMILLYHLNEKNAAEEYIFNPLFCSHKLCY